MNIEDEFSKENLTITMAKYEMYYQVALGSLISQSHAKDMSYDIDFQQALGALYELFSDLKDFDYVQEVIEKEIQKQAAIDAVQNFVNEHLDLVKEKKFELEPIINDINDEKFFNVAMIDICNQQLENQIETWKDIITEDLSQQIVASIRDLEKE